MQDESEIEFCKQRKFERNSVLDDDDDVWGFNGATATRAILRQTKIFTLFRSVSQDSW